MPHPMGGHFLSSWVNWSLSIPICFLFFFLSFFFFSLFFDVNHF